MNQVSAGCRLIVSAGRWSVKRRHAASSRELVNSFAPSPPFFLQLRILKDLKPFVFVTAHSKGVMGGIFVSAQKKGLKGDLGWREESTGEAEKNSNVNLLYTLKNSA